jgi:hypothetical protein
MIDNAQNKMMTSAPVEKAGFHFPGDGVFHNAFIWAENIEEATKEYLRTRTLIKATDKPAVPAIQTTEEIKTD